jgi:gas vesicle protein
MSEKDELGSFLLGFIIGGLTGAVTALLVAPQSGDVTRTEIKNRAIEIRERATETVDDVYAQAEAAAAEARARFEDLAVVAKSRADEIQQRSKVLVEQIKKTDKDSSAEVPADAPAEG